MSLVEAGPAELGGNLELADKLQGKGMCTWLQLVRTIHFLAIDKQENRVASIIELPSL